MVVAMGTAMAAAMTATTVAATAAKTTAATAIIRNLVFVNPNCNYYSTVMNYWSVIIDVIK